MYYRHYRHHPGHQAADVGHPKPGLKMVMTMMMMMMVMMLKMMMMMKMIMTWQLSIYSDVSDKQDYMSKHRFTII